MIYPLVLMATILVAVCYVLRARGVWVQLRVCGYIYSLVSTQLLMKILTSPPINYRYPATVTTMHFFCVMVTIVAYYAAIGDLDKCKTTSLGSHRRYLTHVLPAAAAVVPSIVFSNQ